MRRFRNTRSEGMKRWYSSSWPTPLAMCHGDRLRAESAAVRVGKQTMVDVSMTIDEASNFPIPRA